MNYLKRTSSMLALAVTMLMLAACGQKSNCNGITFGGGSGGGGGTLNGGGSVCGPASNGGGGGGGSFIDLLYFVGGGNAIQVAGLNSSNNFSLVTGLTAPSIGTSSFSAQNIVIAKGSYLYVPYTANIGGTDQGFVAAFLINHSTGVLSNISGSPFSAGTGAVDTAVLDPQGRFLFLSNQVNGSIIVFQINSSTGSLTPAPGSPFIDGSLSPVQLTVDGTGNFLYFVQGAASTNVVEYLIDQTSGALSLVNQFDVGVSRIHTDPSGKFLFGVGGASGGIDVYSIAAGSGFLSYLASYPTAASCYELTVSPNGNFVYAFAKAGRVAEPMQGFSLDATGALTNLTGSPFTTIPGQFAGQFDPSGTHMFTTTVSGFAVLSMDTTTGIPTNPTPDLSVVATPFFAVTD